MVNTAPAESGEFFAKRSQHIRRFTEEERRICRNRNVYVPVNLDVDAEGNIRPRLIRWIDGRVYEIDRLKHKCRAASTKVGGCGIRYTVMIGGHESFLYNEDEKWFVEAKEPCL